MTQDGVQSVGLKMAQDGTWRICVTLMRGAQLRPHLPDVVDGYQIEVSEDGPIVPRAIHD